MKVAFYIGRFNRGGAETLLADIFSKSDDLPFQAVCVYRSEGNMSDIFHSTNVIMHQIPRKKSWVLYALRLRQYFIREGVDIVHAQTSLNAIIAILCTAFTHIKVVNTFHGFTFAHANKVLQRLMFAGCSRLIFVSRYELEYYLKQCPFIKREKCRVVYNGIDFSRFDISRKVSHSMQSDSIRLCMVGSFGEGRNHLFVCKFLSRLKSSNIKFKFFFIGAVRANEQSIFDSCVQYCQSNGLSDYVEFLGLRSDVPNLLATMDAFVYATRHDSFGIAVVEAMASGVPTFVNDWGVMNELTEGGQYATLYKTDDIEDLYEKFNGYLNKRSQYDTTAQNTAVLLRQKYSIERHILGLTDVYDSII